MSQTGKWVLKQLRDQRFQVGGRSFTTYTLTTSEVAYYTLLADGDVLQVWSVYYPGHLIVMFFLSFRRNMNGFTKSLGINLGPFSTGPTLSQMPLLQRQTQQVLMSRYDPQQLRPKGS